MPKRKYPWEFWAIPKFIAEDKQLKEVDKLVLGILITRSNGENEVPAKIKTMAEQLGVSDMKIRRSLNRLKKKKFIGSRRIGRNRANQYSLLVK